jgi:hypothetical protein
MTDTSKTADARAADIRLRVENIIQRHLEGMYEDFDQLHKRGIHDHDVVAALEYLGDPDVLDGYADWAEIDLREDDNTTLNPAVPDPGGAESYKALMDAYDTTPGVGVVDRDLEMMKRHLPIGTKVIYGNSGASTEGYTCGAVFVAGGVPVVTVTLINGRVVQAAALTSLTLEP